MVDVAERIEQHAGTEERTGQATGTESGTGCLITHLAVHDAAGAIDFYKRAFGAVEELRAPAPDGRRIWHASLMMGSSKLFLSDDFSADNDHQGCASPKTVGGTTSMIYFYVPDADATFERAVAAGAEVLMPLENMFWGDRFGKLRDPFGHEWGIAAPLKK
jgi:PhnB protein